MNSLTPEILFAQRTQYSAVTNLAVVELFNDRYMVARGYARVSDYGDQSWKVAQEEAVAVMTRVGCAPKAPVIYLPEIIYKDGYPK